MFTLASCLLLAHPPSPTGAARAPAQLTAAAAVGSAGTAPLAVVLLGVAMALFVAVLRLLRRVLGMVGSLLGSASAAMGGLFAVLVVGLVLVGTMVMLLLTST